MAGCKGRKVIVTHMRVASANGVPDLLQTGPANAQKSIEQHTVGHALLVLVSAFHQTAEVLDDMQYPC